MYLYIYTKYILILMTDILINKIIKLFGTALKS